MSNKHQEVVGLIMQAVDKYPIDVVVEAGLTIMGKLAANMREARLASECALMLAFTDAMHLAFEKADSPTPNIRLYREPETMQ